MDASHQDIVVAAEALRAWLHAQRATWSDPTPVSVFAVAPTLIPPAVHDRPSAGVPGAVPPALVAPTPEPIGPVVPLVPPVPLVVPPVVPVAPTVPIATVAPADPVVPTATIVETAPTVLPAVAQRAGQDNASVSFIAPSLPLLRRNSVRAALAVGLVAILAGVAVVTRPMWSPYAAGPGTAAFDSVPAGAEVLVDGSIVGTTPVRVDLPSGNHAVEFRLDAATRTQNINVRKGHETAVNIEWNPPRFGGLQVTSDPTGAKVLVDGHERGVTPLTLAGLLVGPHVVQIESTEGSVRRKVDIGEGETEALVESIYPGWLHVSAPIEVTVIDGTRAVQLDDRSRALLKPGAHTLRIENRTFDFTETRQVQIEPGGTTRVAVEPPGSTLTIIGSTGAAVFVDGVKAGETPLANYAVKLGTRDIMVVDSSGTTRHATVIVTTKPVQLDLTFAQ